MKKHERALRDAKWHVEDVKDDVQEEGLGEEEAGARVREAEAEVDSARRTLQVCAMRLFRSAHSLVLTCSKHVSSHVKRDGEHVKRRPAALPGFVTHALRLF